MKIRVAGLGLILGLMGVLTVSATTLVRMSLDQLTQAASDVIEGRVMSQQSQWNAAHTQIVTLTTFAVDSNVKGNTSSTVVIEQLGGTVGHFRVYVPDTVHFFPQSKYMLFLEHLPSNAAHYRVVGMMEGAYRIYTDPHTRQERVINPVGYFFGGAHNGGESQSPATMPLNTFQQQVSGAMAKPIVIPAGTVIPIIIQSASFNGAGRILVEGRTVGDIFPNRQVVIPSGSLVDGWGSELSGHWVLHWTAVSIRGRQTSISATNEVAVTPSFKGEHVTAVTK
ncbi:MAG: hypothetical protein ACRD2B_08115 [Terriglobia bacterium]